MAHGLRLGLGAVTFAFGLLGSLSAHADTQLVRWYHPEPSNVDGFRILRGGSAESYEDDQDIGLPELTDDVYSYAVEFLDSPETHVAIVAYNADGVSAPSNSAVLSPSTVDLGADETLGSAGPDPALSDDARIFPAPAGSLLSEDFSTALSADWIETGANNSLVPASGLFEVRGVAGTNALSTLNESSNIHAHFVSSGSHDWSDYELRGRLYISSSNGGVGVTAFSDYPNSDTYYRLRRKGSAGQRFELTAHPDGSATLACGSSSTGVVPVAGAWYVFRMRALNVGTASVVEGKVWRQGETEPTSWQARCEDGGASRRTAGKIGVWSMGAGLKAWDDLEVVPVADGSQTATPLEAPTLIEVVPVQ